VSELHESGSSGDSAGDHVVELVRRYRNPKGKVVLDLGCGDGAMAEAIREMGLTYVGLDSDGRCVRDLKDRGFEAVTADLSDPVRIGTLIESCLDGRPIAACTLVDFLAHVTDASAFLQALRETFVAPDRAPVIVAVPNVTHIDVAVKLLLGRFDYTDAGLLDRTQVAFYSPSRLDDVFTCAGWMETGRLDFELGRSDQSFPVDAAVLVPGTPIHDLLLQIRQQAGEGAIVDHFVRAYTPREHEREEPFQVVDTPFLSVLVRTQGRRECTVTETLLSLAAQTVDDFEVLLLAHDVTAGGVSELRDLVSSFDRAFADRVRVIRVEGGSRARPLNVGLRLAKGMYVTALDDDDVAFAHWVETFRDSATANVGSVVRAMVAQQGIEGVRWSGSEGYEARTAASLGSPEYFEVWDHLSGNGSPFCGVAIPRSCFTVMGVHFDESLSTAEEWDVLLQAALVCGVTSSSEVTSIKRLWQNADSSPSPLRVEDSKRAGEAVFARLDRRTVPLPPGALGGLRRRQAAMQERADRFDHVVFERNAARGEMELRGDRIEELLHQLHTTRMERDLAVGLAGRQQVEIERIRKSMSWKLTGPLRSLRALYVRGLRRTSR
jgi:hypothetical protein